MVVPRALRPAWLVPLVALAALSCSDPAEPVDRTPAGLEVIEGQDQEGALGETLGEELAVRLTNAAGRPLSGIEVEMQVLAGGGSSSATTATTDASGIARFEWTLGTRLDEAQRATLEVEPLPPVELRATAILPATAELVREDGDEQEAAAGTQLSLPLRVRLQLADGRPVRGAPVAWSVSAGNGAITPTATVTDADGHASAMATLGPAAGPHAFAAEVEGLPEVSFMATATAGAATSLQLVDGDDQRAAAGTVLPLPLRVRVVDANVNPVPGAEVQWRVLGGGGTIQPASGATNNEGIAAASWVLGPVEGEQQAEARLTSGAVVAFRAAAGAGSGEVALRAVSVVPPERFLSISHITSLPGDPRTLLVDIRGYVYVMTNDQVATTPLLDISDRVRFAGEQGLLSIALHPQFASNGFMFVNYTDAEGATIVERYTLEPGATTIQRSSVRRLMRVPQPFANHNGGLMKFGPDGYLYIGFGDGGAGGDPFGNGQNMSTVLGKMLRIDVDAGDPYAIPPGNPFVGQAGVPPEIWALGLRNPWRFSFDPASGMLYLADVGQAAWEEVNAVPWTAAGVNYGWNILEGTHCYSATTCDASGTTLPVLEYDHTEGCSVTGGYVYRGTRIPELVGHYFYADFCRGWIRSFRLENGVATARREWSLGDVGNIITFGIDGQGELYFSSSNLRVYRLERAP